MEVATLAEFGHSFSEVARVRRTAQPRMVEGGKGDVWRMAQAGKMKGKER